MEPSLPISLPPIHLVRERRVVLDADLAKLYGVTTMAFNQAVRRNRIRFPADFAFQLSRQEVANLISQIVISSTAPDTKPPTAHGGTRKLPWAFTEHGAIMAAMILRSPLAVEMSVYVVRAFAQMRQDLLDQAGIREMLLRHDKKLIEYDGMLREIVENFLPLLNPPAAPTTRRIGFYPQEDSTS